MNSALDRVVVSFKNSSEAVFTSLAALRQLQLLYLLVGLSIFGLSTSPPILDQFNGINILGSPKNTFLNNALYAGLLAVWALTNYHCATIILLFARKKRLISSLNRSTVSAYSIPLFVMPLVAAIFASALAIPIPALKGWQPIVEYPSLTALAFAIGLFVMARLWNWSPGRNVPTPASFLGLALLLGLSAIFAFSHNWTLALSVLAATTSLIAREMVPGRLVLFISSMAILLCVLTDPTTSQLTNELSPVPFMFLLVTALIIFATLLSLISIASNIPLLLTIGCALLFTALMSGNMDYPIEFKERTDEAFLTAVIESDNSVDKGKFSRPFIDSEIQRWKQINNCADDPNKCPPPIIVAASGGGSRAALFVSSILSRLTEVTNGSARYRSFDTQLFAISGVSGGSVGAAAYLSVLTDFRNGVGLDRECLGPSPHAPPPSVYDCQLAFLKGNFLGPVFWSYAFGDIWGLQLHPDRGTTLARAWERRYKSVMNSDTFSKPFLEFRNAQINIPGKWVPLLFLNATSVGTGKPVVLAQAAGSFQGVLSIDTYDFHDLVASSEVPMASADISDPCDNCDIPLSVAASISSRFPLITPHATVISASGSAIDRIVDGGYFENSGSTTLSWVAEKLWNANLRPVVLSISNDSSGQFVGCVDTFEIVQWISNPPVDRLWIFRDISVGINAFIRAREARGSYASLKLCREQQTKIGGLLAEKQLNASADSPNSANLEKIIQTGGRLFIHLNIPQFPAEDVQSSSIPISWWLSDAWVHRITDTVERLMKLEGKNPGDVLAGEADLDREKVNAFNFLSLLTVMLKDQAAQECKSFELGVCVR